MWFWAAEAVLAAARRMMDVLGACRVSLVALSRSSADAVRLADAWSRLARVAFSGLRFLLALWSSSAA